jgi:enamine deaminase RidA (YjgF/YER057c/UK114 family)
MPAPEAAGTDGRLREAGGGVMKIQRVFSDAPWESLVGYCRALEVGGRIFVTGTAPVKEGGGVHAPGDAYAQARRCLELIERALARLGAMRSQIVRTRMFVTDISRWAEYGRAHAEFFGEDKPATTMVEVRALIDPQMLIEIEADAVAPE